MPVILAQGTRQPPFTHPMEYRATLTGVLKLKDGIFRSRYRTGAGYATTARGEIIVKPRDPCLARPVNKLGKTLPPVRTSEHPSEPRKNLINKALVRARISGMINMLVNDKRCKAFLGFWTVTFKEGMKDELCYQILNTWLTSLRQQNLLKSYLWIAERQQNGTVHYHLAVPHYLNARKVNKIMRTHLFHLQKIGLLPGWSRDEIRRYNGVHIAKDRDTGRTVNFASPKKSRALARYLSKYLTKNETELGHAAWHNSRDWSALVLGMCFTRAELSTFVTCRMLDPDALYTDHCEFRRWARFRPPPAMCVHLAQINYSVLYSVTGRLGAYLYCLN